jgi:hypothetical protein
MKIGDIDLRIFQFLPIILQINIVLNFAKCKNYTIDNFTNM